jgi:Flavin-binding monooxygenase-like
VGGAADPGGPSPRIAIVGAGPSGLAALRALREAGFDAVAYERGSRLGGIWTLDERSTAAYRSLHLITSRERTEFGEFPMPDGTPDYPARDEVGRYLEGYADAFGLREHIRFDSGVRAARRSGGAWELDLEDGSERANLLVVASGHNDQAKWPEPPYAGDFDGRQLHALDYGSADDFRGARALVVGMGNSAMDIATDLSYTAERTLLSVRNGSWVIPKRLLGQPADQVIRPWVAVHVPWRLRQPLAQLILRVTVGPPERYGLPAPSRGLFQAHPTISDTILSRISHGTIQPKPAIQALAGQEVLFADGSREPVDAIVWCTGYRVAFPFLDSDVMGEDPSELPLYKRVFHLERDDLFFIGLMQSTGSAFPIVELQSRLLAAHLSGDWAPPSPSDMRADCERRRRLALRRWGPHGRPSMRVDFDGYMYELAQELERGRKRAAAGVAA